MGMNVIQPPSIAAQPTDAASPAARAGDSARRLIAAEPASPLPRAGIVTRRSRLALPLPRPVMPVTGHAPLDHAAPSTPRAPMVAGRIGQAYPGDAGGTPPRQDCFNSKSPPDKIYRISILYDGH